MSYNSLKYLGCHLPNHPFRNYQELDHQTYELNLSYESFVDMCILLGNDYNYRPRNLVPNNILDPRNTWENKNHYDTKANELAKAFNENFTQFSSNANKDILEAAPKTSIEV